MTKVASETKTGLAIEMRRLADIVPYERNPRVKVRHLEHKLGIQGSPTCVMEYEGATGWLIGLFRGLGRADFPRACHGGGDHLYSAHVADQVPRFEHASGFPRRRRCRGGQALLPGRGGRRRRNTVSGRPDAGRVSVRRTAC